jgi:hypothetical protein
MQQGCIAFESSRARGRQRGRIGHTYDILVFQPNEEKCVSDAFGLFLRRVALATTVLMISGIAAHAACNTITASTSGVTITIAGTGTSNRVGFCVTNDVVLWGLFGSSNGANPAIDSFNNLPMEAGGLAYTNITYTSGRASYTLVPVSIANDFTQVPEYDITLNSITSSGTDTITVWYASNCSHSALCPGSATTNTSFTITVNLPPAPTVTSISPTSGPPAGGTSVSITGTDFTGTTGVGGVRFGATSAASYTVNSATSITATSPAGTGTVDVTVTNNTLTSATSAADQFTYLAVPTVTSVSPTSGPVAGGTSVTITGTNFTGATGVTIGGAAATAITVVNATTITATTPAHVAGTANVAVTTPDGTGTGSNLYTYVAAPTVGSVSPTSGPTGGGTSVTITGTNFTGATAVTFGGVSATGITVVNSTTITATTPAHAAGTVDVVVTTPGGTGTGTNLYSYVAAPTVTSVSPTSGSTLGGTSVTITGTNFTGATAVTLGGTAATSFTVNSATSITATTTAHAAGLADVVVTAPGGTGTGISLYTFAIAPTVSSISPAAGAASGGTSVTITGANLTGSTAVIFGSTAAAGFTVNSATSITATAPSGSGTVHITVTNNGQVSATSSADQFSYLTPPAISMTFGAASVSLNASTSLTFTLTNPNATIALAGLAFTDSLPAGLVVSSPNGLTNTCGGSAIAVATSTAITLSGGTLAANTSCTIAVNVTATTGGAKDNLTSNVSSTNGGTGGSASATLTVGAVVGVPALSTFALGLLALMLMAVAVHSRRTSHHERL